MMILGRSVYNLEDSPARRVALHDAEGRPIPGVFALMRLLPKAITEKMLKPAVRKAKGKDEDAAEEAILRWMREHVSKALVDTEGGFGWAFDDAEGVKAYAPFFAGLTVGEGVTFDSKWTEALKERFFIDNPAVVGLFLDAYKRLAEIGGREREEEEAKKESPSLAG